MSAPLVPVLCTPGLAAVIAANAAGLQAEIAQVAIGRGTLQSGVYKGYAPVSSAVALQGEMTRVPILYGSRLDPHGFRVTAVLPAASPGEYPINEIGFFLASGQLLALWSDPLYPLAAKTALADVELAFDLLLEPLPLSALTINVLEPDIPDVTGVLAELLAAQARIWTGELEQDLRRHARLPNRSD